MFQGITWQEKFMWVMNVADILRDSLKKILTRDLNFVNLIIIQNSIKRIVFANEAIFYEKGFDRNYRYLAQENTIGCWRNTSLESLLFVENYAFLLSFIWSIVTKHYSKFIVSNHVFMYVVKKTKLFFTSPKHEYSKHSMKT